MSLIVCVYVPTGIVMSGDSRTTGVRTVQVPQPTTSDPNATAALQSPWILSDNARKIFCLGDRIAVGTWGDAFLNNMPIAHYINEFARGLEVTPFPTPEAVADALLAHFQGLNSHLDSGFFVAGYDESTPYVFHLDIKGNVKTRVNVEPSTGNITYGSNWGGDFDILSRLFSKPEHNPPFNLLNLQDAVDLTRHLIRATIDQMRFEPRFPTVGGHIDTISATPSRSRFLVRKELHAKPLLP